jgi:predicted tellurium resistance membrane protein TerC
MMRLASTAFIKLLNKYPSLETTAYLMVLIVGIKLFLQGFHFEWLDFHSTSGPAFWVFWGSLVACILWGFLGRGKKDAA